MLPISLALEDDNVCHNLRYSVFPSIVREPLYYEWRLRPYAFSAIEPLIISINLKNIDRYS